jgi:hypothetical protein
MSVAYAITDDDVDVPEMYPQAQDAQITQQVPGLYVDSASGQNGWLDEAIEQLRAIGTLGANWDAEGAAAPDPEILQSGLSLLACLSGVPHVAKPHINPTRDGAVQFEWESASGYLEIEVVAPGSATFFYEDQILGVEHEGDVFAGEPLDVVVWHILRVAGAI